MQPTLKTKGIILSFLRQIYCYCCYRWLRCIIPMCFTGQIYYEITQYIGNQVSYLIVFIEQVYVVAITLFYCYVSYLRFLQIRYTSIINGMYHTYLFFIRQVYGKLNTTLYSKTINLSFNIKYIYKLILIIYTITIKLFSLYSYFLWCV